LNKGRSDVMVHSFDSFSLEMILFSSEETAPSPKIPTVEQVLQCGIKATNSLPTCSPLPKVESSHPPRLR
jgi:hypothetical protein